MRQRGEQNGNSGHSVRAWPCMTRSQIGQRTLIIGNSALGLLGILATLGRARGRSVGFAGCAGRIGGGLGGAAVLLRLGRRLVRFTAIVCLVKSGALEEDRGAGAEQPPQLGLLALRTF